MFQLCRSSYSFDPIVLLSFHSKSVKSLTNLSHCLASYFQTLASTHLSASFHPSIPSLSSSSFSVLSPSLTLLLLLLSLANNDTKLSYLRFLLPLHMAFWVLDGFHFGGEEGKKFEGGGIIDDDEDVCYPQIFESNFHLFSNFVICFVRVCCLLTVKIIK